ncbi:MAG: ATP-binding cassette domain-containing protein [Elusimicrobiales bacterium]|nr:ATP-binding cassette domain-containing protein [Elusimicrobiales bacterium]
MLITESLIKKYSNFGKSFSIKYPDLHIREKSFTLLKGKNGSGKTTLLDIFSFMKLKSSGKFYFNGLDVDSLNDKEMSDIRKKRIIYIPQNIILIEEYRVYEIIRLFNVNNVDPYYLIDFFDFKGFLNKKVKELSGGELRRLQILCCLIKGGDLILADEIFNDMDEINRKKIMSYFVNLKGGKTIIVVDHNNNFKEIFDNVIELG